MGAEISEQRQARTFLGTLRRDTRGNTLAMMAMFLVPVSGLAGSAIDTARLYVVKVRLQQACDAGVLAGRKFMTDSASTTLDATATTRANTFFANNFTNGWMRTQPAVFTPTKTSDSQVNGTASVVVPMTIMKMFGVADTTISVTCRARFDVADTDIMFVLDTTGSMACAPADDTTTCINYATAATKIEYSRPNTGGGVAGYAGTKAVYTTEKTDSRIKALREAVMSFYDTFAANADPSTNVRYGFVTYSSSVNVGQAIRDVSPGYLFGGTGPENVNYQSRRISADATLGSATDVGNGKTRTNCDAFVPTRDPSTALTYFPSSGTATRVSNVWYSNSCKTRTETLVPRWEYRQLPFNVSNLVAGNTISDPTKVRGQTMSWVGCIETKVDTSQSLSFTTTNLPSELNPDLEPSGNDRWRPHLQDLSYLRNDTRTFTSDGDNNPYHFGYGYDQYSFYVDGNGVTRSNAKRLMENGAVACGKPVKRLGVMTRTQVYNYVYATDFVSMGGTYHDTGMIWGTRLISPSGPWRNDTGAWPGRNAPNRVIVFLTDGDMAPNRTSYSMYGVEKDDERVAAGDDGATELTAYHNARFLAECSAAKARNIDVWTVAIDSGSSTELQSCATTTAQALFTTNGAGLATAFEGIARKLAMLRLTQ